MALTVGVNTYISLQDARQYVKHFNLLPLPVDDQEAEEILTNAAISLDHLYGGQYIGQKQTSTQPMDWLRNVLLPYDSYGDPRDWTVYQPELGEAQTTLTSIIQSGVAIYGQPAPKANYIRHQVGTLVQEIHTSDYYSYSENALYTVTLLLQPLLESNSGKIYITRGA
jgi:hypothetical protein